ncbi:DUF2336 domain-containing protein [Brevundimonas faecalis]|uniref:Uncharacterized protein (DUF2336 family) n=1 Tax=Brevundimonas faecalis TaxID=947378 RepID=A0ABV2R953_9CAUL
MPTVVAPEPIPEQNPLPQGLDQLLNLARARTPQDRGRLILGVADLYRTAAQAVGGAPSALADVFIALTRDAEHEIRRVLAVRLSEADWAPADLVKMLAADEIEIARPVIASSPLLQDQDLLQLLADCSLDHQIQVALRPGLGAAVARRIVERRDPTVMTALATNRSARIADDDFAALVEHSRHAAALRAPLARHPALDEALALRLYHWVGDALRQAIGERFDINPVRLTEAAVAAARQVAGLDGSAPADPAADEADARLTAKLHSAGQLRPAYLIRALREEKLGVFIHGMATLGGFDVIHVRRALSGATARPLFLACLAVGLDRAAFPALLTEIRKLNKGFPLDPDGTAWRLADRSADQAAYEFRLLMIDDDQPSV